MRLHVKRIACFAVVALLLAEGVFERSIQAALLASVFLEQSAFPMFEDITEPAGVAFTGAQFGAAWGDYDGDSWPDLFVSNHFQNDPNIYHNNGNGTLTDVIAVLGAIPPESSRDIHGSGWGDFDNDGDLDVYLTSNGNSLSLFYVNQGSTFLESAGPAGIGDLAGRGRAASWIDYDKDGLIDLFVSNAKGEQSPDKLFRNTGAGAFVDVSSASGLTDIVDTIGNVWGDYDGDGDLDLVRTGGPLRLHRNNGDSTFTDVTAAAGLGNGTANTWGADFGDYDNDGDLDLYVSRGGDAYFDSLISTSSIITFSFGAQNEMDGFDFQSASEVIFDLRAGSGKPMPVNNIYIGADSWHPANVPFTLGAGTAHTGMPTFDPGVSIGVYVWQDAPSGTWHVRVSNIEDMQGQLATAGEFSNVASIDPLPSTTPDRLNKLFRNQGNGTFTEVSASAGVNSPANGHGATWGDYDNDGLLDLYVVNSGDATIGDQSNQLYHNNGDGTFTDRAAAAGVQSLTSGLDDCAVWADFDHNGFLDLFVMAGHVSGLYGGPHKLYRNLGNANHWLDIHLVGVESNRQGTGAKVVVSAGTITQTRYVNNGHHYRCQNSPVLHYGLGSHGTVDTIDIVWPSGQRQILQQVAADRLVTIVEGEAYEPTPSPSPAPTSSPTQTPSPTPTPSLTPTLSPTSTPTPTASSTPAPTTTSTPSPTQSPSPSPSAVIYLPLILK